MILYVMSKDVVSVCLIFFLMIVLVLFVLLELMRRFLFFFEDSVEIFIGFKLVLKFNLVMFLYVKFVVC